MKCKSGLGTIADMRLSRGTLVLLFLILLSAGLTVTAQQAASSLTTNLNVEAKDLLAQPVGENWTSYNGDYSGRRYSSLREINPGNVAQLRAAWVFHPGNSQNLEVTPLVVRGIMFVTSSNNVFALDARTGRTVWHYQRPVSSGLLDDAAAHKNRGVAVWRDSIYAETDDAHLLCLDARSGGLRWDIEFADKTKHYGATSAPLVINGLVIVGSSGGDSGVRGFVAAYDALTGKLKWRFWTIPAPGEFGFESWPGDLYLHGGGTAWMSGTYDPGLNILYWGTSNPAPDFEGGVRPGDDLYAGCVLALEPDTGQLKWYFQFTPHDLFDYDATETPILIDAPYKGEPRKLLVEANRNGFIYVLDRVTGQFLSAISFVSKLNWAKGIDAKGRPILTHVEPTPEGTRICPGFDGATNWFSPSYNESTHLVYFLALEECETFFLKPEKFKEGQTFYSTGIKRIPTETSQKILLAYNLETQSFAWRYPQAGHAHSSGGTMTTAGGLLFFGDDADSFEALDAQTGKPLWHFNTGQDFSASPMSYAVDGKQYVAIAAGSDIFSFSLP